MSIGADASIGEARCPLCGGANACLMAATRSDAGLCWCTSVHFDDALIARVPGRLRGAACICAACAGDVTLTIPVASRER